MLSLVAETRRACGAAVTIKCVVNVNAEAALAREKTRGTRNRVTRQIRRAAGKRHGLVSGGPNFPRSPTYSPATSFGRSPRETTPLRGAGGGAAARLGHASAGPGSTEGGQAGRRQGRRGREAAGAGQVPQAAQDEDRRGRLRLHDHVRGDLPQGRRREEHGEL